MRAAAIYRFGGPEVLVVHSLPVPAPDPSEVLIELDTAGVGPWDAGTRDGSYADRRLFPLVLGTDGAGTVAAGGSRIRRFKSATVSTPTAPQVLSKRR
ncbi:MAG: alcohol dehydrogenase catalytic domain-containing protein [Burkholderiales bacterium]